jgi:hypothetical protein
MDNQLLHYLYNKFRCHPNYGSDGPIYDWMIIKFNIGLFPCQLVAMVQDDSTSAKEVHLVVQSTTTRTLANSTLFQEWNWSPEYKSIQPNTIEAPCFVISLRDDNSQVLEILA